MVLLINSINYIFIIHNLLLDALVADTDSDTDNDNDNDIEIDDEDVHSPILFTGINTIYIIIIITLYTNIY